MKLAVGTKSEAVYITAEMADEERWGVSIKANGIEILCIRPEGDVYMVCTDANKMRAWGFQIDSASDQVVVR